MPVTGTENSESPSAPPLGTLTVSEWGSHGSGHCAGASPSNAGATSSLGLRGAKGNSPGGEKKTVMVQLAPEFRVIDLLLRTVSPAR